VNAEKKRREMVLLETSVYKIKMGFNERFLALRDLKTRIIEGVKDDAVRMAEIDQELSDLELDGSLPTFEIDPSEFPETRMNPTSDDAADSADAAAGEPVAAAETAGSDDDEDDFVPEMSELELAEHDAHRRRLQHERASMLERVDQTVAAFDDALQALRRERFTLTADLKTTEMKLLLLFQELELLEAFELREVKLTERLGAKTKEKSDVLVAIDQCQEKLEGTKKRVDEILKEDAQILKELKALCGDSPFYEQLFKTFKRKIKRVKPKELNGDDDSEEETESESDYDSDSDEEEEEEDVCPQGCSQELFDKVCALRERRLDQEEANAEVQKDILALKKENDTYISREKAATAALQKINADIQTFQTEKQGKLNELQVVVTLKLHQVQYLSTGKLGLPPNTTEDEEAPSLEKSVVMTTGQLAKLAARIGELEDEKRALRRRQKEIGKNNRRVAKGIKAETGENGILRGKFEEVQMLKFGQLVDLDKLEKMADNKQADVLKAKVRATENLQLRELTDLDNGIRGAQHEYAEATRENTIRLQRLADLTDQQHTLEMALNSTQGQLSAAEDTSRSAGMDEEEKQRLVQLVRLQEREINALKAEINLLRMKGGHVYTPSPQEPTQPAEFAPSVEAGGDSY